ncbi:hypothetical protein MMC06_006012 [Schaereria dolodes]|nr:hypothetical protein [Schaereria dolodes]
MNSGVCELLLIKDLRAKTIQTKAIIEGWLNRKGTKKGSSTELLTSRNSFAVSLDDDIGFLED